MSVVVTVALTFKPGLIEAFWRDILPGLQAETQVFPGVHSTRALRKLDASNEALFIDVFESVAASDAYFAWRRSTGVLEQLETLLEVPPKLDLWPLRIGDEWIGDGIAAHLKGRDL
jgi:quinol monooxygenase YgiN